MKISAGLRKLDDIASLIDVCVTFFQFDTYKLDITLRKHPRIQGVGPLNAGKEEVLKDASLLIAVFRLGDHILEIVQQSPSLKTANIISEMNGNPTTDIFHCKLDEIPLRDIDLQSINSLVYNWTIRFGLPSCDPNVHSRTEESQDDTRLGWYSFDVLEFAQQCLDIAIDFEYIASILESKPGLRNSSTYRSRGTGNSILDRSGRIPLLTLAPVYPVLKYQPDTGTYGLRMLTITLLDAVRLQMAYAALGNNIRTCRNPNCLKPYIKEGKGTTCGPTCESAMKAFNMRKTRSKPVEERKHQYPGRPKSKKTQDGKL